jgi:adenine C2-methylase RlmN of 23S rRNA A2503 and tRNA A37
MYNKRNDVNLSTGPVENTSQVLLAVHKKKSIAQFFLRGMGSSIINIQVLSSDTKVMKHDDDLCMSNHITLCVTLKL